MVVPKLSNHLTIQLSSYPPNDSTIQPSNYPDRPQHSARYSVERIEYSEHPRVLHSSRSRTLRINSWIC